MRRLHLKLFYLRTRHKREAQGVTAKTLGVRPATMSHLEQGRSLPTLGMLLALCKHYDITPSYLLDDERPIEPGPADRWTGRNASVAPGAWVEVPQGAVVKTNDGMLLCPVMQGARAYDSSAQAQRLLCRGAEDIGQLESQLRESVRLRDTDLEEMLVKELLAQRKPRNKKTVSRGVSLQPAPESRAASAEVQ